MLLSLPWGGRSRQTNRKFREQQHWPTSTAAKLNHWTSPGNRALHHVVCTCRKCLTWTCAARNVLLLLPWGGRSRQTNRKCREQQHWPTITAAKLNHWTSPGYLALHHVVCTCKKCLTWTCAARTVLLLLPWGGRSWQTKRLAGSSGIGPPILLPKRVEVEFS